MANLKASQRPLELLEELATPAQPPTSRMYRAGFEDLFELLPTIDARAPKDDAKVALTERVMGQIAERVTQVLPTLNLPSIADNKFGRVILGIEDPTRTANEVIPGTEVVLALWGKGFTSPVHGHATGYIHEALIQGGFDVFIYDPVSQPADRLVVLNRIIEQRTRGIFYSEFVREEDQEYRSALVHNFTALDPNTMSLHYLPEHVRDGSANRFSVIGSRNVPLFNVDSSDVTRVSADLAAKSSIGDVYLVRSKNVGNLGDHYILITGGLVQKSHGLRPNDAVFAAPADTPLSAYDACEDLVLLKLNGKAQSAFHDHFKIINEYRANGVGLAPADSRIWAPAPNLK